MKSNLYTNIFQFFYFKYEIETSIKQQIVWVFSKKIKNTYIKYRVYFRLKEKAIFRMFRHNTITNTDV